MAALPGIEAREALECLVHGEDLVTVDGSPGQVLVGYDGPAEVHQYPPHCLGGDTEAVGAVFPGGLALS